MGSDSSKLHLKDGKSIIQEVQKLKQQGEQQGYHAGKAEARIVADVRIDPKEEDAVNISLNKVFRCGRAACNSEGAYECNGCRNVYYCCMDHQKQDWEFHRRACALYSTVKVKEGNNKRVVAGSSLDETFVGSVILEERPLVILPQVPSEGDYMVCIGCCKPISWEEKFARCSNCSWPVCHDACDGEVSLHSNLECNILGPVSASSHWNKRGGYESLWVIRIICLKTIDPVTYERIMSIDLDPGILEKEDVVPHRYFTVQTLRRMYEVQPEEFSDEELNHVWNILRLKCVNNLSFLTLPFKRAKLLYENVCNLSHSCYPNASYEMDDNFTFRISLQRPLEADESFSINFDSESLFQPTRSRRGRLQKIFKIECSCSRCTDVTELGTYFGGIPCHSKTCNIGERRGYLLQTNYTDCHSPWECLLCHTVQLSNLEVQSWLYSIQQGLESVCKKQEPYQLCIFVDTLVKQQVLHEYHHLVFDYYVETLKLFNQQLENDSEKRNINELLKYKQAAKSVCKIMRSFLPIHTNLIGPLPQLSTIIKMAGLVEGFKNKTVQMNRVLQDLERYVVKTDEYGVVLLRNGPLVVPANTRMQLFIDEIMESLASQFQGYIFDACEDHSPRVLEDLKIYFDVIQKNFCGSKLVCNVDVERKIHKVGSLPIFENPTHQSQSHEETNNEEQLRQTKDPEPESSHLWAKDEINPFHTSTDLPILMEGGIIGNALTSITHHTLKTTKRIGVEILTVVVILKFSLKI
ncbi:unnamed protein product [Allacma fusca]|uniref:MYND-type domain-containing protein n=1 Tax=Allacma fusca TaxID=39272 RepID=A0A8J2PZT1_9HEXA|nr:unnamed protein product [Allacma fusca]